MDSLAVFTESLGLLNWNVDSLPAKNSSPIVENIVTGTRDLLCQNIDFGKYVKLGLDEKFSFHDELLSVINDNLVFWLAILCIFLMEYINRYNWNLNTTELNYNYDRLLRVASSLKWVIDGYDKDRLSLDNKENLGVILERIDIIRKKLELIGENLDNLSDNSNIWWAHKKRIYIEMFSDLRSAMQDLVASLNVSDFTWKINVLIEKIDLALRILNYHK